MKKKKILLNKNSVLIAFRKTLEMKKLSGRYHTVANYVSFINRKFN